MILNPEELDVHPFSTGAPGEGSDTIPGPPTFDDDTEVPDLCN